MSFERTHGRILIPAGRIGSAPAQRGVLAMSGVRVREWWSGGVEWWYSGAVVTLCECGVWVKL